MGLFDRPRVNGISPAFGLTSPLLREEYLAQEARRTDPERRKKLAQAITYLIHEGDWSSFETRTLGEMFTKIMTGEA